MTRLLAWCTGSTLGLVVGFLAGTVVRDRASFATLTAPVRPVEARNAGRGTSGRADDGTGLTAWMAERGLLHPLDDVAAEFGVNLDGEDA